MCILVDFKHKCLIDSKSNNKVYPSCFDDLLDYHGYLINSKHPEQAEKALKDVFNGELVMTNLVNRAKGYKA